MMWFIYSYGISAIMIYNKTAGEVTYYANIYYA